MKNAIAFIVPDIYPCASGGMEIYYNRLLKKLKSFERILLFTSCDGYDESGITIVKINKRLFGLPGTSKFYSLISALIQIFKNRGNIKLIHFPYTSNAGRWGYLLPLVAKCFSIEYIIMIHDGTPPKWRRFDGNRLLFKYCKGVVAVSEKVKQSYQNLANQQINVIYPLVEFDKSIKDRKIIREEIGLTEKDRLIIFIGSLKDLKAPQILLNAFISLGRDYVLKKSLKLYLVGKGELMMSLQKKVEDNAFQDAVVLTGIIPYEKIPDYYKAADIYVIPSKFEGTSKSLLEAMFNELLIIGSDVSGINNVLTDNYDALLFPSGDVLRLKELLVRASEDASLGIMGANALTTYNKKYAYQVMIDQLRKEYN